MKPHQANHWADRIGVSFLGLIGLTSTLCGGLVLMTGHNLDAAFWTLPVTAVGSLAGVIGVSRSHSV